MEKPALSIRNLTLELEGRKILDSISLMVQPGETVGIIGPNGSGKTTLFNTLSGFHRSGRGSVVLYGADLGVHSPHRRAQLGLGRVFQSSGVFRDLTVVENVLLALESREGCWWHLMSVRGRSRTLREEALVLLREIRLEQFADRPASCLSGGQARLLEMVRARALGARVFLLDEPTAGVSPKMKDEVGGMILKLQKDGCTILVIEHDMSFIQAFCDRIVVLDCGKVILDGRPEEVRRSPELQELYFGAHSFSALGGTPLAEAVTA